MTLAKQELRRPSTEKEIEQAEFLQFNHLLVEALIPAMDAVTMYEFLVLALSARTEHGATAESARRRF